MKNFYLYFALFFAAGIQGSAAQCTNASAYGGGTAPTGGGSLTMSTCNFATEYATVTGVTAGQNYTVTSSIATDFITVRSGTFNGPVVASGTQPLNFTATVSGSYFIHFNTNAACGTNTACRTTTLIHVPAGCNNATLQSTVAAPALNATITVNACHRADRHSSVTGAVAGRNYTVYSSIATDYITIRQTTAGGPIVAAGLTPLSFTAPAAGTYFIHINTNSACGTSAACRNVTMSANCLNTIAFGFITAPTGGATTQISTCQYATEYATVDAVVAGNNYIATSSVGTDFITVRFGAFNGPVVATGTTPLNWTASLGAGTYFIHFNTNNTCGTASVCRTTSVTHVCGVAPAAPTGVTATPATICPGATSNLNATSAGNTIRWYTVPSGGANIGTSASGANFGVTPAATTTYYAESFNGSCPSTTRTAVTVNVSTAPAAPTNVSASPAVVCSGSPTNLNAQANATGFTGPYAPASWTISRAPVTDAGSVNAAGAPASISMTSSNNGSGGASSILYTVNVPATGTITFNWNYTTTEVSPMWDYPQYAINGTIIGLIPGFSGAGGTVQSGTVAIAVTAGQTFSLVMTSGNNTGGPATTVFSSFAGPGMGGSNTVSWFTVASGGAPIGTSASGANFSVSPVTTTTYYAQSNTAAGCASATRTPVIVTVEVPTVPSPVTATPSAICVGQSTNLNGTSGGSSAIINGFTGPYAPSNWTTTFSPGPNGGTVNTSGAPASISMTSSDLGLGSNQTVIYTVTAAGTGNITFNWSYLTVDVGGSSYDVPEYAINGVVIGFIPGFVSGGPNNQSGTATIPISAGQTFSLSIRATDDILGSATIVYSNFAAPGSGVNNIQWFTTPTGGTPIGTSATAANFPVTPGSTITYYAQAITSGLGCISPSRTPVTVTVNTFSTTPLVGALQPSYCPNSTITLTASGGTAGSGSAIQWYTGPNGTGTYVGSGASINVNPAANTTYYVRREGICNTTTDDVGVVVLKNYIYAANGTSTSNYCTSNDGWNHFFVGDNIILSVMGNMATLGTATATIWDNNAVYTDGGNPSVCSSGLTPGEAQFEMERSWNINVTGVPTGTYNVRYYFMPAEQTATITAANNWMATYAACGYTYKYAGPSGWFWFKNQGAPYTAPWYDDNPTMVMLSSGGTGTTPNGINYAIMSGVTSFSGGTGGVILIPDPLLNNDLLSFTGQRQNKVNVLDWTTTSETNCSHYVIERSKNAGSDFVNIGEVAGNGTSNQEHSYRFIDEHPFFGMNYYRLRQVSFDGDIKYSKVIAIDMPKDPNTYSVFPNPTTGDVTYQCYLDAESNIKVEVVNALGQVVRMQQHQKAAGIQQLSINLQGLPTGSYVLRMTHNGSDVRTEKVIKTAN